MASKTLNTILSLQDNTSKKLVGVSKNFKNLSKEAQKATLSAQKSLNNLGKGIEKTVTNAASKVAKIGTVLGALGIGTGLSEAMDLEGYRTQLETATKSTQKAAEIMKYSIDLANKTPFEGGEMVEASSKLESMGISAKSYLTQIVDMAAATNKPLDQATEAFIDAQTGELERLKEFGIKKADIQAKANEMFAGQETINNQGQITNQENFNKALLAIMEDRYTGGAEKLSKTTKGMWSTITGVTKNALAKIVGIQDDGTVKSGTLIDKIREKMQLLGDKLTKWQSDGTLDNIASKATEVFSIVYNVLSKVINFAIQHKDIIITIASMAVAFTVVSKAIRGLSIATKAFQLVWALLKGTIALTPVGWIVIGITALVGTIVLLWNKCQWFRNGVMNIFNSLVNMWNTLILPLIKSLIPIITPIITEIKNFLSDSIKGLEMLINGLLTSINGIINFITGVFTGNWSLAWEGVKQIFAGVFEGLKGVALAPLNFIIEMVNKAIGAINKISFDVPSWVPGIGGNHIGVNIPTIPKLATGSSYTKKGLTLVGEHGPELVNMPSGAKVNTNSQTNKILGGGKEINLNIKIDTFIGEESFADKCGQIVGRKILAELSNM